MDLYFGQFLLCSAEALDQCTCFTAPPGVPAERGRILPGTSDCHKTAPPGLIQIVLRVMTVVHNIFFSYIPSFRKVG